MKFILPLGRLVSVAAVCALAFFPALARADFVSERGAGVEAIRSSNTAYWGSVGASQLNYKESVSPIPDSQRGTISSVALGTGFMGFSGFYLAADGSVSFGDDHYRGAYRSAPTVPIQATTHAAIVMADVKVGKGFALGDRAMATPYFNFGYRYWERDLGGNQYEYYHHYAVLGGAMLQYSPVEKLVLSAYGAAGRTFGGVMRTDGVDYDLGGAAEYKLGGKIGYTLTERFELFTTLDFDHFRYVKSEAKAGIYEPSSFTNDTAVRVGIAYHLK
jgi:hypothetical protein